MANCVRNTIDSNVVGLSFAETICGRLPTIEQDGHLPTWYELEPNSYSSFGGSLTTMARAPINASRQRKKGTVVDLDAGAGFEQDWTQNNFDRLLQGFFFADWREKPNTRPMNGDVLAITEVQADRFVIAGGGVYAAGFAPGMVINVTGMTDPTNNGQRTIAAVSDTELTVVGALEPGTAQPNGTIEVTGYGFTAGGTALTVSGGIATLTINGSPLAASGTITVDDNTTAPGDTLTVGNRTYAFVAGVPTGDDEIPLGADALETAANIEAAINGSVMRTEAHDQVAATVADEVVALSALYPGTTGNSIVLATDSTALDLSGGTLAGGTGISFTGIGFIPGEWVYLGGDAAGSFFEDNRGYARILSVTDTAVSFDKTTWEVSADAGTGVSLSLYMGNVIKNEPEAVTHMYEFRRTLGRDLDGVQSEYVERAVANELTLNVPLADKATAEITFVAGDKRNRTGAEGIKPGETLAALSQDAFNTSSDVYRVRMSLIDPTTSMPDPFFAYLSEYNLNINNNVGGVKAIGVLGNLDVSVGVFEIGGDATAFFTNMAGPNAIRANADVTVDAIFAKHNAGFIWDIPLLTVGGGEIQVSANDPVTIPLEQMAAENQHGYTLLYMSFAYLPNAAMPDIVD